MGDWLNQFTTWVVNIIISLLMTIADLAVDVYCYFADLLIGVVINHINTWSFDQFGVTPADIWNLIPQQVLDAMHVLWLDKALAIYISVMLWRYKWSILFFMRR